MGNVYYLRPGCEVIPVTEIDALVEDLQNIAVKYHDFQSLPAIIRKCLVDSLMNREAANCYPQKREPLS
ncbi:hypothetical protein [[Erwinia] mediterraneensis]|uniref:hypothetical protein n=1 Tax=[Erwinia] mediterraneensis TaxID=2161819 RepID=UPI001030940B|nr:hypothetical protein [[Erwinia] mediterraneensis]